MTPEWMTVGNVTYLRVNGAWYQAHEAVGLEVSMLLDEIARLRATQEAAK